MAVSVQYKNLSRYEFKFVVFLIRTKGRKRRSTSDIEDRMTWTEDAGKDLEKWFLNIARYLKYEMFDKGGDSPGECKFEGLRLVSFSNKNFSLIFFSDS